MCVRQVSKGGLQIMEMTPTNETKEMKVFYLKFHCFCRLVGRKKDERHVGGEISFNASSHLEPAKRIRKKR